MQDSIINRSRPEHYTGHVIETRHRDSIIGVARAKAPDVDMDVSDEMITALAEQAFAEKSAAPKHPAIPIPTQRARIKTSDLPAVEKIIDYISWALAASVWTVMMLAVTWKSVSVLLGGFDIFNSLHWNQVVARFQAGETLSWPFIGGLTFAILVWLKGMWPIMQSTHNWYKSSLNILANLFGGLATGFSWFWSWEKQQLSRAARWTAQQMKVKQLRRLYAQKQGLMGTMAPRLKRRWKLEDLFNPDNYRSDSNDGDTPPHKKSGGGGGGKRGGDGGRGKSAYHLGDFQPNEKARLVGDHNIRRFP